MLNCSENIEYLKKENKENNIIIGIYYDVLREIVNKYKNKITITTDDIKKIVFLLEDPKELSKLMAYNMTVKILDCYLCINYLDNKKCTAFPEGIPEDILTGKFNHIKKHPEQKNNILFEPIKE